MAKGSIQIPKIIKAMEKAIESTYASVGRKSIDILKINEEESDTTGRLADSFSWATQSKESGVGSKAASSDGVPKPSDNSVIIGTRCPYALSVDKGTQNQKFAYGVNGNPNNFEQLHEAIFKWIQIKISNGTFQGDVPEGQDLWGLARRIAKDIEANGTDAHPFWDESLRSIISAAKKDILKEFSKELGKIKDASQEIGVKR